MSGKEVSIEHIVEGEWLTRSLVGWVEIPSDRIMMAVTVERNRWSSASSLVSRQKEVGSIGNKN